MTTKSKVKAQKKKSAPELGFLPDFSRYLFKKFPIEKAYENNDLINKLRLMIAELLIIKNPARELQDKRLCKKLEFMTPEKDRDFIKLAHFDLGKIYYAAFGNNPYRIIFGLDTSQRIVYFLALDTKHSVR